MLAVGPMNFVVWFLEGSELLLLGGGECTPLLLQKSVVAWVAFNHGRGEISILFGLRKMRVRVASFHGVSTDF